jgi:polyphosphate kinase 2 (PPK2 family)
MHFVHCHTPESKDYEVLPNGAMRIGRKINCAEIVTDRVAKKYPDYLSVVDEKLAIENKKEYKKLLRKRMAQFNKYAYMLGDYGLSLIGYLQGDDGAGKSGTVGILDEAIWRDHKIFRSVPIGAPTPEELKYPFLWRFNKLDRTPQVGQITIFDRTHQGRFLDEKVLCITPPHILEKSYADIRIYEHMAHRLGSIQVKIWLSVSFDEQGRRFQKRIEEKPKKKTEADDLNRGLRAEFHDAANLGFYQTGTEDIPQYVVCSNDKPYCHIAVLEIFIHEMKKAIKRKQREQKKFGPEMVKFAKAQKEFAKRKAKILEKAKAEQAANKGKKKDKKRDKKRDKKK